MVIGKGDHIRVPFVLGMHHHAIAVGDGSVVELSKAERLVRRVPLDVFARGRRVDVVEHESCLDAEEVVKRALSRVGDVGYDVLSNNCEHFAWWCKTGDHRSRQSEAFRRGMEDVAALIVVGVGLAAAFAAAVRMAGSPGRL